MQKISDTFKTRGTEDFGRNIDLILPQLIEERIKANLEPLNEQISTLTQLLNQLIQNNSAKTPLSIHRPQTVPSFNREAEVSRNLSDMVIGGTRFSLDTYFCSFLALSTV